MTCKGTRDYVCNMLTWILDVFKEHKTRLDIPSD